MVSQRAFVVAVRKTLNLNPTQLGQLLGEANAYNRAHDYEVEGTRLRYEPMMAMLEAAGWLTPKALKALARAEAELAKETGQKAEPRRAPLAKPQRAQESL